MAEKCYGIAETKLIYYFWLFMDYRKRTKIGKYVENLSPKTLL
jgi:hypothetical protein